MAITGEDLLKKLRGETDEDEKEDEKDKEKSSSKLTGDDLLKRHKAYQSADTSGVDQKYIDSFIKDSNAFLTTAEKDHGGLGWGTASSAYESRNTTWQDLNARADTIGAWLYKNRDSIDRETYDSLNTSLEDIRRSGSSVMDAFKNAMDYYSQWDTEVAYNNWYTGHKQREDEKAATMASADFSEYADKGAGAAMTLNKWGASSGGNKIAGYRGSAGAIMSAQGMRGGATDPEIAQARAMTEDEVNVYNYYYAKYGEDRANEYFDSLKEELNRRLEGTAVEHMVSFTNDHPVLASAVSPIITLSSAGEYVGDLFTGDNRNMMASANSALRGTVSNKVDWEIGNWDAFDFLYNTAMSGADSLAMGQMFGPAGGVVLGLSAAASATNDALDRGLSNGKAFWNGLTAGVFEGVFETISIGNFNALKEGAATSIKAIAKNIGKSMLVNASEETLTEIANVTYDLVANGELSKYALTVNVYIEAGMSEAEAKRKAALELAGQVVEAGASGALMGFGFGTIGSTIGASQKAKQMYGNGADLVTEALDIDPTNEFAQKMQAKVDAGKSLSGSQINRLVGQNEKAIDSMETTDENENTVTDQFNDEAALAYLKAEYGGSTVAENTENTENTADTTTVEDNSVDVESVLRDISVKELTKRGEEANAEKFADIIVKQLYGRPLTTAETAELEGNQNVQSALEEVQFVKDLADMDTPIDSEADKATESTPNQAEASAQQAETVSRTENAPTAKKVTEGKFEASEKGKATHNGNEVKIQGIASTDNGEVMVQLDNGEVVNARDVVFSTADEALIYEATTNMDADTANDFIQGFNDLKNAPMATPLSAYDYMLGFNEARTYGELGIPYEAMVRDGQYANALIGQAKIAYNRGKINAIYKAKASEASRTSSKATPSKTPRKYNGETHVSEVKKSRAYKSLSDTQKAGIAGMTAVYKELGIDVYFFESPTDSKGNRTGKNGYFNPSDNSVHIDLYAGLDGRGLILFTGGHELTHYIRANLPTKFKAFAEILFEQYEANGTSVASLIAKKRDTLEKKGRITPDITSEEAYDLAYEEVVADACEPMLGNGEAFAQISEKVKAKDEGLWNAIKKFFADLVAKIKAAYAELSPDSVEGQKVAEMLETATDLQQMWVDMLVEASEASDLAMVDASTESVAPMFSERTWTASEYVIHRDAMAKKIAKALGVSTKKAKSYIDDINSIAKMIADDRTRLDYEASSFGSAFVSNVEYGGSFDYTTLCKKRRIYTGTFTEIQKRLHDVALSPDDILKIRNLMIEEGIEATCGLCYVEGSRANMGKFAKEFIRLYKRDNPGAWIPNMADVNTPDGVEQMRINHPEAYDQYVYFWNHYGKLKDSDKALFASQQKPKLYEARKEYKGEILDHFKGDTSVARKNLNGGIRMQSFSDFEIVHLIDTMQVIMDMSTVGLAGQAYTKVPEFAKAFGNTGLKINLSLIAKGVDADGNLIFDDREGMPHETAFALRNQYSANVGTIIVTFTDEQLLAAMADPRIDFIIPFHRSQWKKGQYGAMGLPKGTKDYTYMQNEKFIKKTYHEYRGRMVLDKASNYMPNEYWDFSKSGKENAEAYLKMCAENNKRPKFYKFLDYDGKGTYSLKADGSTDGYWKLLIDFKMYDNNGVGSPQQAVTPTFNMDEAKTMLDEYKGGHSKYPVASSVVDTFVNEYNKANGTKYSDRDSDYMDAVNRGDMETAQRMVDEAAKKAGLNSPKLYHGTKAFGFTEVKTSGVEKGMDWSPFFAANKEDISASYVPYGKVRDISSTMDEDAIEEARENAIEEIKENISDLVDDFRSLIDRYFSEWVFGQSDNSYLESLVENANPEEGHGDGVYDVLSDIVYDAFYDYQDEFAEYEDVDDWSENSPEAKKIFSKIVEIEGKKSALHSLEMGEELGGIYQLYANLDNMYVVDCKGVAWNELRPEGLPKIERGALKDVPYKTRDVAKWARDNGFNGVIFKNIKDNGAYGRTPAGDVYAFFRPESQVKSADPVTYDDSGNVIPLSERFNADNNDIRYSDRVTDPETLDFLNGQIKRGEYITVYRSFQLIDGGLYAPMNAVDRDENGKNHKLGYRSEIGQWEMATESRAIAQKYMDANPDAPHAKFDLDGVDNKTGGVAYNPYLHASNLVLNDQFSAAYRRNLVTVECRVPLSEANGAYKADYAKDATGWADWKSGKVAGELKKKKPDFERKLFLSRYMLPYRILSDSEVASMYKEYLDGTDVPVPWNVVTPSLRKELEKAGVNVSYADVKQGKSLLKFAEKFPEEAGKVLYSDREIRPITEQETKDLAKHFGTTGNFRVAGYLLTDGKLLDFSGKHWGDTTSRSRQVDHRDVGEVLNRGNNGFADMVDMIGSGNIRLMPEIGGINLAVYPNEKQRKVLSTYINYMLATEGQVIIDYDAVGGDTVYSREYGKTATSRQILTDIRNYFNGARQSELMQFHTMYSDRSTDSVSNRSLLANALESVAQNDIERKKLKEYKGKIALIESEQAKLAETKAKIKELSFAKGRRDTEAIKKLQFEANQSANRINTYDRQLLNLEATAALKGVLQREKQLAYKKAEKEGKEALAKYREKAAKTQRELLTRYQESRQKGIEGRRKTEMRHKIKNVVSELNQYLLKGTKEKHVPIELQKAVAEALDAVNMDTVNAEERIAKKRDEMLKAKTPEAIEKLAKEIANIREMGGNMASKISSLKTAYDSIINSDDPLVANSHDDVISASIDKVVEVIGDTPLRDMSLYQLEAVYDLYKMVLHSIRAANKAFKAEKGESIAIIANGVIAELVEGKQKSPYSTKASQAMSEFNWNNQKPVYAFERIGSKNFTKVFNAVREGEDVWANDMNEAQAFREEQFKKYKYDSWDFKKRYRFTSTSGKSFELSLDQILSLYSFSKRAQAGDHLKYGGFVFDGLSEVKVKNKVGMSVTYQLKDATAYNLSEETLTEIIGKLTPEQKEFADAMQDYLSTVMGEKGNEVSLELYDIKLFKEKNYFPLKSAPQYLAKAKEQAQGEVKIKNSGFTKETSPKAKNPIVLSSFMDVWAGHVNEMSMYHAFTLPLEDFYRVYNYHTPADENMSEMSVSSSLENAHGQAAVKYIDQLLKDLNGGAVSDPRETLGKSMMSRFKKASVMASLSVVVQQPTAIVRAMAVVNSKYFLGKPLKQKHKDAWAEVKKYAPVAVIKEMGYFDTGMGKGSVEWLKGEKSFMDKVDDATSKLPALADEATWVAIWKAVKRETVHTHKHLAPNSDAFLKAVGERFTEVITKTQVYDSTLSRSANMRSKSTFMNMVTSFLAEPTTSINMLQDAFYKGNKKHIARTMAAVYGSVILNSALVSIVYAMRDDDEDETFLEKYLSRFTTEVIDGVNPLTYLPIVKDIWSAAQGFDIERADMSLITDLIGSFQQMTKVISKDTSDMDEDELAEHKKAVAGSVFGIIDSFSSIAGIPVKNIRRDINGTINFFKTIGSGQTTTAGSLGDNILEDVKDSIPVWGWLPDESKGDKLYDAIIKGDEAYIDRMKSGYKSEDSYYSAVGKIVREHLEDGDLTTYEAERILVSHGGKTEEEASSKVQYWEFKQDYPDYDLSEEAVAKYYTDVEPWGINMDVYYDYYQQKAECKGTDEDGDGRADSGTKKAEVMAVIDSLPISNEQKDALYYLNGWSESTLGQAPWH